MLDCRDMECPRPVLETKGALERLSMGEELIIELNTLSGKENCKRFLASQGVAFSQKVLEDGTLRLHIFKEEPLQELAQIENPIDFMIVQERRSAFLVILAGFVGALLSASCCLVPTLFLLFGVSFAGVINVAALEPYRPLFTLVAVALLSLGFYQMVIKKQIECDCEPTRTAKVLQLLFWVLFVLTLAALLFPYYEAYLWQESY